MGNKNDDALRTAAGVGAALLVAAGLTYVAQENKRVRFDAHLDTALSERGFRLVRANLGRGRGGRMVWSVTYSRHPQDTRVQRVVVDTNLGPYDLDVARHVAAQLA